VAGCVPLEPAPFGLHVVFGAQHYGAKFEILELMLGWLHEKKRRLRTVHITC